MARSHNRTKDEIKEDIESIDSIFREDVYDLLKLSLDSDKTKEESIVELSEFLDSLNTNAIVFEDSKQKGIDRIINDIDSYNLEWKDQNG